MPTVLTGFCPRRSNSRVLLRPCAFFLLLPLLRLAGRVSPRRATYFLLLRQKRSRQRKGDPGCRVPPLRCGQPAVLGSGGVSLNSLRSDNAIPDPPEPALLGASTRGGDRNTKQPKTKPRIPKTTRTRHGVSLFCIGVRYLVFRTSPSWLGRAAQVARSAAKGPRLRVAFSFAYFSFGEAKEK